MRKNDLTKSANINHSAEARVVVAKVGKISQ